jgi:hypothetical protein
MSRLESPITRAFWEQELGKKGTLYEEFRAVQEVRGVQSWRALDGMVVLGDPDGVVVSGGRRCLDGEDVVVIQTKATPLNPYVFGQALLSKDLIRQRWAPRSIRSILLCTDDDPELRPVTDEFPEVEVFVRAGPVGSFPLPRLPAEKAGELANERGTPIVAPARLTQRLMIDGVLVPDLDGNAYRPLQQIVAGKHVTTVHSEKDRNRRPAIIGMWASGEIIVAQRLLARMGAASVHSIMLCRRDDRAVGEALRRYATYEVELVAG